MDINEIEKNLNNQEADPNQVLNIIMNLTATNQAILETLIEMNMTLLNYINPDLDLEHTQRTIRDRIAVNLAEIQASIASKLE